MMNSAMFSSVQETLQSRRGRKRWKGDFWGPQGGGDHRGKRYFKGSVRGCELVRKRLNPQLWSRLLGLCVCARWWNLCFEFKVAMSRFLPWFILILLWLIDNCFKDCMRGYTLYLVNFVPDIFCWLVKLFMETNMIPYLRLKRADLLTVIR